MTETEFFSHLPVSLTGQQKTAVTTIGGPVLLLAVPGSGKTTVLVIRIAYMIYVKGVAPESILVLTYTTAAAADMKNRFIQWFGQDAARLPQFRTINGVCATIINYCSRALNKPAFELITDDQETAPLLRELYRQYGGDGFVTDSTLKDLRTRITWIKNQMSGDEELAKLDEACGYQISRIYAGYRSYLRNHGKMDYDDQMVYALSILQHYPQILSAFSNRYPWVLVDEAQDNSRIQHVIIRLLTKKNNDLFMVGDEDQSIYGFRAACPDELLAFKSDHPDGHVLLMEENFRSDASIVEAANLLIRKNTLRHKKTMIATHPRQTKIHRKMITTRSEQLQLLVQAARNCVLQTAVLYRNNESALPLVDLLEREQIPYRIRNTDLTFFSNRVMSDVRTILAFAENPADPELFLSLYYKLGLYVNKQKAYALAQASRRNGKSPLLLAAGDEDLYKSVRETCRAAYASLQFLLHTRADTAIDTIENHLGYADYLHRSNLSASSLYILRTIGRHEKNLKDLLARMDSLQILLQNKASTGDVPFILSTIHSSKGLEYDRVILYDVIDGILPEAPPANATPEEKLAFEEEARRVLYVGITRARHELTIYHLNGMSDFLDYLFLDLYKASKTKPSLPAAPLSLEEGDEVQHQLFGRGSVLYLKGDRIRIRFANGKESTFSLSMLKDRGLVQKI